jgi:hypothetical protein
MMKVMKIEWIQSGVEMTDDEVLAIGGGRDAILQRIADHLNRKIVQGGISANCIIVGINNGLIQSDGIFTPQDIEQMTTSQISNIALLCNIYLTDLLFGGPVSSFQEKFNMWCNQGLGSRWGSAATGTSNLGPDDLEVNIQLAAEVSLNLTTLRLIARQEDALFIERKRNAMQNRRLAFRKRLLAIQCIQ